MKKPEAALARLTRPLHDVYALRRTESSLRPKATRVMSTQMHRRGKAFWQWSAEEWCDVVGVTAESFEAAISVAGKTSLTGALDARCRSLPQSSCGSPNPGAVAWAELP